MVDKAAAYDAVRFLPRATTIGMVIVIALQLTGQLGSLIGFVDVIALGLTGLAARRILQSRHR